MLNKAILMGRVGKTDTKSLSNGNSVTNLSMVTTKRYTDKQGVKQEKVTWHNVSFFAKLSEIVSKYVKVGDLIYIEGEIDVQKYTGQDGIERTRVSVLAHDLKMMPKAKEHVPQVKVAEDIHAAFGEFNDEIPF